MIGLALLIAGIVLWVVVTTLTTLGIILTLIGGIILAVQFVFFIAAAITAWRVSKEIRSKW
jgi:hypothetical protein